MHLFRISAHKTEAAAIIAMHHWLDVFSEDDMAIEFDLSCGRYILYIPVED